MAAGKVSVSRRGDVACHYRKDSEFFGADACGVELGEIGGYGFVIKPGYGVGKSSGAKRISDREEQARGNIGLHIDDGIVLSPAEKRRKLSDKVFHSSLTDENLVDQEPGQLDEEDFSHAPNISTSRWSRWAYDDDLDDYSHEVKSGGILKGKEMKGRSSSPESGVTQMEGSDASGCRPDGGFVLGFNSEDECPQRDLVNDDCMELDLSDDEDTFVNESYMDVEDVSKPGVVEYRNRNMLQGCRSVFEYEKLGKISEGSYGIVYKAREKKTGEIVALKKLKMARETEGFPVHYLREINTLLAFNHPSVVNVREVVVDDGLDGFDNIYMVMDYMEHDLKALMQARKQRFSQSEVKSLMLQLLEGIKYLHDNWVLHRDLKTSNLLLNNKGELKICDFGMSRQYGSPLKPFTALVVTLWYRAPELLLGAKEYSTAVDMWSVGCIMAELLTNKPLFDGKTELEQLNKIFKILGTPNDKIWPSYSHMPGVKANFVRQPHNLLHKKFPRASFTGSPVLSDLGLDLLSKLLTYDPEKRITVNEALNHWWFQEAPLPMPKDYMPTFPAEKVALAK